MQSQHEIDTHTHAKQSDIQGPSDSEEGPGTVVMI